MRMNYHSSLICDYKVRRRGHFEVVAARVVVPSCAFRSSSPDVATRDISSHATRIDLQLPGCPPPRLMPFFPLLRCRRHHQRRHQC